MIVVTSLDKAWIQGFDSPLLHQEVCRQPAEVDHFFLNSLKLAFISMKNSTSTSPLVLAFVGDWGMDNLVTGKLLINHNTHDFEGTTPALGLVVSAMVGVVPTRGFRILKFDEDLNYAGVFFEDNTNFVNGSTRWHSFENNPNSPNSFVGLLESGGSNRIFAFDSTGVILVRSKWAFGQSSQ